MNLRQSTILAVDDDPMNLDIIDEYLSDSGYAMRFAETGEQALEILRQESSGIDLILLDRMMPGIDGIEVLKRIKQDKSTALIPVIMVTASGEPEQVSEGIRAGCFYYLTKPFDRSVLREVVMSALRDHACRTDMQASLQKFRDSISSERSDAHQATMVATYYYLNNALNLFQLILMEIETKGSVDEEILREIKASIFKTVAEVREFGQMENPTRESVEKFIHDHLHS